MLAAPEAETPDGMEIGVAMTVEVNKAKVNKVLNCIFEKLKVCMKECLCLY